MWVRSLGQEDPLEEGLATHSSALAWRIPWTGEPSGLQSMESQRVGTCLSTTQHILIPYRRLDSIKCSWQINVWRAELGGKGVLGKRSKGCDLYIVPLCFLWGPFRQPPGCGRDPGTRAGPQFWDEPWHPGERLQLQDGRRQRRLHHEPFNRASTLASAAPGAGLRPGTHIRKQLGKELPGFLARALVEASRKKVHELDSLERSTRIAEHRACGLSSLLRSGGPGYGLCLEIANNPRIPRTWFWFVPIAPSGPGKATRQRGHDQMGARWGYDHNCTLYEYTELSILENKSPYGLHSSQVNNFPS